jgi:hypothetical protein
MLKTRVETGTTMNCGTNAPEPGVPADNFGMKIAGILRIDKEGTYGFKVVADDKITLTLDGKDAAVNPAANKDKAVDISMTKGDHAIKIWFVEVTGAASYTVSWKPPGAKAFTAIPAGALMYDEKNLEKYQKE